MEDFSWKSLASTLFLLDVLSRLQEKNSLLPWYAVNSLMVPETDASGIEYHPVF